MIDLKNILKLHPNCLSSRASFRSVLLDKYPNEKRVINILTILVECGIANRIKEKGCNQMVIYAPKDPTQPIRSKELYQRKYRTI